MSGAGLLVLHGLMYSWGLVMSFSYPGKLSVLF